MMVIMMVEVQSLKHIDYLSIHFQIVSSGQIRIFSLEVLTWLISVALIITLTFSLASLHRYIRLIMRCN